jgi:hypothetical protein
LTPRELISVAKDVEGTIVRLIPDVDLDVDVLEADDEGAGGRRLDATRVPQIADENVVEVEQLGVVDRS